MLDHGHVVLLDHCLAGGHLHDDVALRELQVLQLVDGKTVDGVEVVLRLLVHRVRVLIHGRGEPLLLAVLTVLLGERLEIGTGLEGVQHAVGSLAGSLDGSAAYLNLTVLDRVWHHRLGDELHHVEGVVTLGLERSRGLTYSHRVELGGDIRRIGALGGCDARVGELRLSLADYLGGVGTALELRAGVGHRLQQGLAVGCGCHYLEIDVLDVAGLNSLLEHLLLGLVLGLEILILNLHVVVVDRIVVDGCELDIALLVLALESDLG